MRHRAAVRISSVLAVAATALALPAPASAAAPGVGLRFAQLPATLTAGGDARTVTVVASADRSRRCQKVRWSLLLTVTGVALRQVRVDRVAESGGSPLQVRAAGDTARITDVRFDPRALCPGRTVTARYVVAVTGSRAGRIAFVGQAFNAAGRLLRSAGGRSRVVAAERATPTPTPSPSPSPSLPDGAAPIAGADPGTPPATAPGGAEAAAARTPSVLGPGLIVGALLVFVGVGLLLRLRLRRI